MLDSLNFPDSGDPQAVTPSQWGSVALHRQRLLALLLVGIAGLIIAAGMALDQWVAGILPHLSAALQIASDRLLPLLQVLPIATQKLQTIN